MSNITSLLTLGRLLNGRSIIMRCQLRNFASQADSPPSDNSSDDACKAANLAKKLRAKTPIGKLDELEEGRHPFQEKEPLRPWPDNTNPHTGEVGGPKGPEPTRYGDWERKGRVTDF